MSWVGFLIYTSDNPATNGTLISHLFPERFLYISRSTNSVTNTAITGMDFDLNSSVGDPFPIARVKNPLMDINRHNTPERAKVLLRQLTWLNGRQVKDSIEEKFFNIRYWWNWSICSLQPWGTISNSNPKTLERIWAKILRPTGDEQSLVPNARIQYDIYISVVFPFAKKKILLDCSTIQKPALPAEKLLVFVSEPKPAYSS